MYVGDGVVPWQGLYDWPNYDPDGGGPRPAGTTNYDAETNHLHHKSYERMEWGEGTGAPQNVFDSFDAFKAAALRRVFAATNCIFEFGSAQQAGGAVMVANGHFACTSCLIHKNEAGWMSGGAGGGLHFMGAAFTGFDLVTSTITGNRAMTAGGIKTGSEIRHMMFDGLTTVSGNFAEADGKEAMFETGSRVWPYNVFSNPYAPYETWDTRDPSCESQPESLYRSKDSICRCSNNDGCMGTGFAQCPPGMYTEMTFVRVWDVRVFFTRNPFLTPR